MAHHKEADSVDGIAGKHLRTLARLALIQPELRHIAADLGYVFAEVVDKTAGKSVDDARNQLGQVRSATGTFQNVAQRALAQARAQKGEGGVVQQMTAAAATQASASFVDQDTRMRRKVDLSNLSGVRDELRTTLKEGNLNIETIREELQNGKTVPVLEELRKHALASATTVAKGKEDLERMQAQIDQGKIPPEVMNPLQAPSKQTAEGDTELANGDPTPTVSMPAPLTSTDLADAIQMLAVANKQMHLAPSPEQIKQMANQTRKDAEVHLKQAFNDEVKQRLLARTKKLIVDCQSSEDYKEALLWFIKRVESLFELVQKHAEMPSTSLDSALSFNAEPLVQLLENFADGLSIRPLLEIAKQLSLGAKDDPKVRSFWLDADKHLRRCLLEEGFILTAEAESGLRDLLDRFKGLQQSYKEKLSSLVQGVAEFLYAIRHDAFILKLLSALKTITNVLRRDGWKSGSLWNDLRLKVLPALLDKFGVIPVPRIKYLHPDFDLVIENIALQLKTLLPDIFDFRMANDVHFDFRRLKDSSHSHQFKIKLKGMSLRVYKLAYAFTSRLGITFHDKGIADLLIKDFGVTMYLDVPKDPGPHYFVVRKVKAKLGALNLKVYKSNHRILHFLADKMANSYLTKRILRHFIAEGITLGLKQLDVQLMAMRLGRDSKKGDIKLEDVRRQMAELRDLLRKYHEQAGTLEIDFTRDDSLTGATTLSDRAKAVGKSIEDSHAVRWVMKQVDETGRKEIIRNEWRSNAFDLGDMDTIKPAVVQRPTEQAEGQKQETVNVAAAVDHAVQESVEAATIRNKPEGPTTEKVVEKAKAELEKSEDEVDGDRTEMQGSHGMESRAGKETVDAQQDRSKQADMLEKVVDSHPPPPSQTV